MRKIIYHAVVFIVSVFLFVLALGLIREGARPLAPTFRNTVSIDSPASALGFGWLAASLMLSGSPIAATALSLFDALVLDVYETFFMISGSRLGAAFIVLLIGFLYILRGKQRDISLGVGLTSLLVTQTIYPLVLAIGYLILKYLDLHLDTGNSFGKISSLLDMILNPFLTQIGNSFPKWSFFPVGFFIMLGSLWLFDRAIPELNLQNTNLSMVNHLLYRPAVTFIMGVVITSITMSVSVSLSLLIPLSARGFVRRENVIPYILGANITTFIDTLAAAAILDNPLAVRIVLVQMISVALVSMIILFSNYHLYVQTIDRLVLRIGKNNRSVFFYLLMIFGIPFLLILLV